jgi:hypothetical protein
MLQLLIELGHPVGGLGCLFGLQLGARPPLGDYLKDVIDILLLQMLLHKVSITLKAPTRTQTQHINLGNHSKKLLFRILSLPRKKPKPASSWSIS